MAVAALLVSDFIISFMWVWSGVLIKIFVNNVLELGHEPSGEVIKCVLSIINMFFFAFLGKTTKGGAYNPLTVLAGAISGDFSRFLFDVGARIPAQVTSLVLFYLVVRTYVFVGKRLNLIEM
jgi:aquaporin SIP